MNKGIWAFVGIFVVAICVIASTFAVMPIISENIGDPNLIAYFNHDEGYLMDLAWYYYSGQKRESFQYDCDYGLELRYFSLLCRNALSGFMKITPGIMVLTLRIFHFVCWLGSLCILLVLVRRHFDKRWIAPASVIFLAVTPSFPYFMGNLKPEPLVFLVTLTGIYFLLSYAENGRKAYFYAAVALAAAGFLVKFAGIFLIPPIALALYLNDRNKQTNEENIFRRYYWLLPALFGAAIAVFSLMIILFYKRRTTGSTWAEEYGLTGSLLMNRPVLYVIAAGILLTVTSFIVKYIEGKRWMNAAHREALQGLGASVMKTCAVFALFAAILGIRWVIFPSELMDLYAQTGREAFGNEAIFSGQAGILRKIMNFNPAIFILFAAYLRIMLPKMLKHGLDQRPELRKGLILCVFILPFAGYLLSKGHVAKHHMLPFYAAAVMLGLQAAQQIISVPRKKAVVAISFAVILTYNVFCDANTSARNFRYIYRKKEDVAFDIARWLKTNYPRDTRIIADHPTRAYLPGWFNNAVYIGFGEDIRKDLGPLVDKVNPQLIYLNMQRADDSVITGIAEYIPGRKSRIAAEFENKEGRFARWPGTKYVIYEIEKDKR